MAVNVLTLCDCMIAIAFVAIWMSSTKTVENSISFPQAQSTDLYK